MMMRDHAKSLADKGFRVVPLHWPELDTIDGVPLCSCGDTGCRSVGKHPLTAHGVKDAATSAAFIDHWWGQYPSANIGIATGYDVDVIDIDGPEGLAAFGTLVSAFGMPLITAHAETGRDGGHHFYTAGGGQQSWTGGFGGYPVHLDCKGHGGYVVAPPSLHASGKRYTWVTEYDGSTIGDVDWPMWRGLVRESASNTTVTVPGDGLVIRQPYGPSGGKFADVVRERVRAEVTGAPEGARWQTFAMVGIWVCSGLVHGGEMTHGEALELCEALAAEIGLTAAEIARVPRELERAIGKRRTPIQSRSAGTLAPLASALAGTTGDAGTAVSGDPGGLFGEAAELERQTNAARIRIKANDAARRQIAQEALAERDIGPFEDLPNLMSEQDETVRYRIDGLWPIDGRTMLAAQFKAGKTTLIGNVVRCLADSSRFLSRYQANTPNGRIAVLDTEMTRPMFRTWFREQGIANQEKVTFKLLRGQCSTFNIFDELTRARWVQHFKDAETEVLILDCLGPILAAMGMNESTNEDVGKFIGAFESLVSEADIRESMIVHHMGHSGERSRGASRLRDWPDVEWHLIREGQEDDYAPSPNVPRYFRAYGRDVNAPEQLLHYEPNMRWLSVNGEGNRKEMKEQSLATRITDHVMSNPGQSGRTITDTIGGRASKVRDMLSTLVLAGTLVSVEGKVGRANALLYFHRDYVPTAES
jgi:hypothetical protein